jgi:hypothetical protein
MNSVLKLLVVAALATTSACGGGDGLPRVAVEGTVTNQGQPVDKGLITFRPVRGASGVSAGTRIDAGRYAIPAHTGPVPGDYEVEIKIMAASGSSNEKGASKASVEPIRMKSFSQSVEIRDDTSVLDFALPFATAPGAKGR